MRVLTARQMREADRRTIEELGVPSLVLMENAGREAASAVERAFPDLVGRRVAVLCGRGNNGGDGFVVARLLHQRGVHVSVFLVGRASDVKGDALANLERVQALDLPVAEIGRQLEWERLAQEFARHTLIVDALFGTGLTAPLTGLRGRGGRRDQRRRRADRVDRPAQRAVGGHARGDWPVHPRRAHGHAGRTEAAARAVAGQHDGGRVVVADIGIPPGRGVARRRRPRASSPGSRCGRWFRRARRDAHKGDFGRVLVVAGSMGKTGAGHSRPTARCDRARAW